MFPYIFTHITSHTRTVITFHPHICIYILLSANDLLMLSLTHVHKLPPDVLHRTCAPSVSPRPVNHSDLRGRVYNQSGNLQTLTYRSFLSSSLLYEFTTHLFIRMAAILTDTKLSIINSWS